MSGAVGSYVITPNLYQCDPSTNSDVNYGGMASSSESVGMAYDSITNQIDLTDANKHQIFQVSYRDNRHLLRVVAGQINDPSPGYVNGIGPEKKRTRKDILDLVSGSPVHVTTLSMTCWE
jgi:hypothetical protein